MWNTQNLSHFRIKSPFWQFCTSLSKVITTLMSSTQFVGTAKSGSNGTKTPLKMHFKDIPKTRSNRWSIYTTTYICWWWSCFKPWPNWLTMASRTRTYLRLENCGCRVWPSQQLATDIGFHRLLVTTITHTSFEWRSNDDTTCDIKPKFPKC